MAFNPFHQFRKHQKVVFAFMTIVAMLTFVLCTGVGGDAYQWLQTGVSGRSFPGVAELYGHKVTTKELDDLRIQRAIANEYMARATDQALKARMDEIAPPAPAEKMQDQLQRLDKVGRDPEFRQLRQRMPQQGGLYFGGSLQAEGLLDFMIWQRQADRLNIQLSERDVSKEVRRLTNNRLTRREQGDIERILREGFKSNYSSQLLVSAIGNELRVRIAQAALLGYDPGGTLSRMPAPITPEEFWGYYQEQQTRLTVRLIPVAVEEFIASVKEKPTEKELKDLYTKHRDKEAAPESSEPGFKRPQRVQVEWVSGSFEDAYYKDAAARFLPTMQAAEIALAAASALGTPLGTPATALQLAVPATQDTIVPAGFNPFSRLPTTIWREYETRAFFAPSYVKQWRWTGPYLMHDRNIQQPRNLAAAVGQAAGDPRLAGCSALSTFVGNATFREMEDRVERGLTWALSIPQPPLGTGVQPAPLVALALARYLSPPSEYLPLPMVRGQVQDRLLLSLARDILGNNLRTVAKEVEAKSKDPKALADYLAKAVPEYHLKTGKTSEPCDRKKLGADPGMKLFKDAYSRPRQIREIDGVVEPAPSRDPTGTHFAVRFFGDRKPYTVEQHPLSALKLEDDREWRSAVEKFIYWKTDDQKARIVPLDDPQVRQAVELAWKTDKARALAKKEAEELKVKARAEKGDERRLRDFAEKNRRKLIELPPMTRLVLAPAFRPDVPPEYQLPRIPEDQVPHAGPDFVNKVLELGDKQKGDTLVQPDQPQTTFYVAVLTDRQEPSFDGFLRVYRDAAPDALRRDPLLQIYESQKQVAYFQDYLKRLREDAKLTIDKDALKGLGSRQGGLAEE